MSKSKTDLYKELGVERNASQDEIKKAFRQMAKKWHPDKNPGDPTATAKFQAISHAYSILSDPDKRLKYDKYGTVNEDEWNFEDFMNNCGIDFDELFSIDNFIDISHPNHSLKLMIVKKDKDIKSELKLSNDYIQEKGLNYLIYGKGKGMKSVSNILTETTEENFSDEWEEVKGDDNDSDNDNEEDEEFEEIEDGEAFLEFIDKNTKNVGQKVMCKLCKDKKKYNIKEIDEHFIKTHEKDYNKSEFAETTPWKDAIQSYEESMKDLDLGFDFLMGGKGDKGKGGFEMDGLFEVMMSMGAMGGMPGGKKNKKKK